MYEAGPLSVFVANYFTPLPPVIVASIFLSRFTVALFHTFTVLSTYFHSLRLLHFLSFSRSFSGLSLAQNSLLSNSLILKVTIIKLRIDLFYSAR
jgi:hypothetical protein